MDSYGFKDAGLRRRCGKLLRQQDHQMLEAKRAGRQVAKDDGRHPDPHRLQMPLDDTICFTAREQAAGSSRPPIRVRVPRLYTEWRGSMPSRPGSAMAGLFSDPNPSAPTNRCGAYSSKDAYSGCRSLWAVPAHAPKAGRALLRAYMSCEPDQANTGARTKSVPQLPGSAVTRKVLSLRLHAMYLGDEAEGGHGHSEHAEGEREEEDAEGEREEEDAEGEREEEGDGASGAAAALDGPALMGSDGDDDDEADSASGFVFVDLEGCMDEARVAAEPEAAEGDPQQQPCGATPSGPMVVDLRQLLRLAQQQRARHQRRPKGKQHKAEEEMAEGFVLV